jgi:hypothetical protein
MAATVVEIWNRALTKIGETRRVITVTDTDVTATTCALHWSDIRDEVLSDFPWPFAAQQVALVEDVTVTRVGWEHVYTLPVDFLVARAVLNGDTRQSLLPGEMRVPFEVILNDAGDERLLACDLTEDDIDALEYTAQVVDPTLYSAAFCDAVAWRLAVELALGLLKDAQKAGACLQMYQRKVSEAFAQQLRGNREDQPLEGSGIRARA